MNVKLKYICNAFVYLWQLQSKILQTKPGTMQVLVVAFVAVCRKAYLYNPPLLGTAHLQFTHVHHSKF
jgi:hypothetical protein